MSDMMQKSEIIISPFKNMIDLAASVESIFWNGLFVVILPARQVVISVSVLVPADTAIQMSNANELD